MHKKRLRTDGQIEDTSGFSYSENALKIPENSTKNEGLLTIAE